MNQLEALQIFVRVADLASFTQTADSLGLPKASVSTTIKQLENLLGARLFHRTTRRVQLTQDGMAFYQRSKDMLADMDELQTMFQSGAANLSGRLRVDMPSGVARHIVLPQLDDFLNTYPGLELEFSSTDRQVDLVREGFDCVLRVGKLGDSNLIARPLGRFHQINCASPAYLARYGTPQNLQELAQHRLVHYAPNFGAHGSSWEFFDGQAYAQHAMPSAITVNNTDSYLGACLVGLGLIQIPAHGIQNLLESGQLIEVLPQYRAEPLPVTLLYANRRHLPKRVQVFMNWMATILQPCLLPAQPELTA
jgi:DNA-binding transcriptional LysR family regulator